MTTPRMVKPQQWGVLALLDFAAVQGGQAAAQDMDHSHYGTMIMVQAEGGEPGVPHRPAKTRPTLPTSASFRDTSAAAPRFMLLGRRIWPKRTWKHPKDDIYTRLEPELEERGEPSFADTLAALASAVESGEPAVDVLSLLDVLNTEIDATQGDAAASDRFAELAIMARAAADEYAIGGTEGMIVNVHEYQDAWGFLPTIRARAEAPAQSTDETASKAAAAVIAAVAETDTAFDKLTPRDELATDWAEILYAAAARIELTELSVR